MKEPEMTRMFLAAATFVIALASPAFAQSFDPDIGSGNIVPPAAQYSPGYDTAAPAVGHAATTSRGAFRAYAQEPAWNGLPEGPVVSEQGSRRVRAAPAVNTTFRGYAQQPAWNGLPEGPQ
jgi:hypothetical protein